MALADFAIDVQSNLTREQVAEVGGRELRDLIDNNMEWLVSFLDGFEGAAKNVLNRVLHVVGIPSELASRFASNTAEALRFVMGTGVQLIFKVMINPEWWKHMHRQAYRAYEQQGTPIRGALAYGKQAVAFFLETLKKIVIKTMNLHNMTVSHESLDFLDGILDEAALSLAPSRPALAD